MDNIYENVVFTGMDFVNEPKQMIKQMENKICCNMTPNEFKAYEYGRDVVFNLIGCIVNHDEDTIFVHINGLKQQEEFVLEELLEKIGY